MSLKFNRRYKFNCYLWEWLLVLFIWWCYIFVYIDIFILMAIHIKYIACFYLFPKYYDISLFVQLLNSDWLAFLWWWNTSHVMVSWFLYHLTQSYVNVCHNLSSVRCKLHVYWKMIPLDLVYNTKIIHEYLTL
jgi:hypothetical protein